MTLPSDKKRPLVFLNADVAGYSRLISDYFESTTAAMADHRELVTAEVEKSGGRLIDFVGDNFMAAFEKARSAVQAAIAIATEIDRTNADIDALRRVRFRMGMDIGDVVVSGGRYSELEDSAAIEKIYQGWYHLRGETQEGWMKAVELFDQVARLHPKRPFGYVLSAYANWIGVANEWANDSAATTMRAREQAKAALDRGDPTGMSRAVEAAILMTEGRHDEALTLVEQLGIIRPTCDVTYGLEGSVRRYLGQWERAVDLLDTAMRLTAINKPWYPTVKACSLFIGGKTEQAADLAEMVLEYQPHNLEALLVLAAAQVELGLARRAKATTEIINSRFPSVDVEAWLDKNPYQIRELVERWKADLTSAGAIGDASAKR